MITSVNRQMNKLQNTAEAREQEQLQKQVELESKIDKTYDAINIQLKSNQQVVDANLDEIRSLVENTDKEI